MKIKTIVHNRSEGETSIDVYDLEIKNAFTKRAVVEALMDHLILTVDQTIDKEEWSNEFFPEEEDDYPYWMEESNVISVELREGDIYTFINLY